MARTTSAIVEPSPEDLCRSFLLCYATSQFPNYQIAKHHQLIARHLEAIEKREINRLLINVPPRHGKCCHPLTTVTTSDLSRVLIKNINPGDELLGYKNGKLCKTTVIATERAFKPTVTITTRSGRTITVSHDHPMLTWQGYVAAEDLTQDHSLVCVNTEISTEYEIPDADLDFITAMLFDGCCRKTVRFSKNDKTIIDIVSTACSTLGFDLHKSPSLKDTAEWAVTGNGVKEKLAQYGIHNQLSYDKRLPQDFFKMSLRQRWRFIDIMFQTDGYFSQKAGVGGITLANEKLIDDIQSLLATCGVAASKSFKKTNKADAWTLNIGRSQLKKIYDNCDLGSKREQCCKVLQKKGSFSMLTAYPWQIGRTLKNARKNGFRCDNKKRITVERMQRMAEVYPELNKYIEMDFFYDQVLSTEHNPAQELVHIQTTGEHNYIANDFVSHNTMLTSEFFIAWYLGRNPTHEVMFATYSKDRAQDTGLKVKQQMERDSYKAFFSTRLRSDSKSKSHLATTDGGALYCVGVGGALTGRGANLFVMDDLVKSREEAESASARLRIVEWFKGTAYTRLMKNGAVVFISTRWHTQDLAGVILQEYKDKWVHLDLPAICIKNKDILGRKKGDPLWPEMFSARDLREIKKVIGTREFNAQYQQQPIGEEGSIIKLDWFQRYDNNNPPEFDRIIQSWDTAYDSKSIHDPSVCTVWGEVRKTGRFYLLDVLRSRMEYPMVKQAIHAMYDRYPKTTRILVENRTSGKSIVKDLQQTSLPILPIIGTGDKIVRLMAVSGLFEAGKVYLPESAPWLYDYETELCQFPVGAHDDQVDSTSQALDYLKQPHCQPSPRPLFWK